jgi:uridine kinase
MVEQDARARAVLLFDGIFIHRPELRAYRDASIFLRLNFSVSVGRNAKRNGTLPDIFDISNRRYIEGQRIYISTCSPESRATMVSAITTIASPFVVS